MTGFGQFGEQIANLAGEGAPDTDAGPGNGRSVRDRRGVARVLEAVLSDSGPRRQK